MLTYAYFYNPFRLLAAPLNLKWPLKYRLANSVMQIIGMYGVMQTVRRTFGWAVRLMFGNIQRRQRVPASHIAMRDPHGGPAAHALPGTPESKPASGSPVGDPHKAVLSRTTAQGRE
jgi:hypothetical protein